ncbi:MAG: uracil-DNA glycosylase [Alphaproteobacteria bacterium]|nr:uracil-DNA glycosylase [Alphaproteobacteria bacterium]
MNYSAILKWYQLSGITEIIRETPVDRFLAFKNMQPQAGAKKALIEPITPLKKEPVLQQKDESLSFVAQAMSLSKEAETLADLKEKISSFEGCSLKKTAMNTFIGVGKEKNPTVFCIFDAPKAPAERSGNLFEGPQGILLQKMLAAIHLSPQNSYIAPLIPWRLPGDRKPSLTEEKICTPFLLRELELTNPDFILIFGAIPTRALLEIESITKARQQIQKLKVNNKEIPVIATFGPDMVSASQTSRKNAWDDLKKLSQLIQNKASNNEEDK